MFAKISNPGLKLFGYGFISGVSSLVILTEVMNYYTKVPELKPTFKMPFNLYRQSVKYDKNNFNKQDPKKVTVLSGNDTGSYNSLTVHEYFDEEKKNDVNLLIEDLDKPIYDSLNKLLDLGMFKSNYWKIYYVNRCLDESKHQVNIIIDDPENKIVNSRIYHDIPVMKLIQKQNKANVYICTKMTKEVADYLELEYKQITIDD